MDHKPRIGIVIQGPLFSRGISGESWGLSYDELNPVHIADHDCYESISSISNQIPSDVQTVLVTWSNQPDWAKKRIASLKGINQILELDEPPALPANRKRLGENNTYRQFWSTLQGLRALEHNCTHVIKIRSDQTLDLNLLLREFDWMIENRRESLFTPNFRSDKPFWLADFFFGGPTALVKDLMNELCQGEGEFLMEKNHSVHFSMFKAFAKVALLENQVPDEGKILRHPRKYAQAWSKLVISSEALFQSLIWRGKPIDIKRVENSYMFGESRRPGRYPSRRHVLRAYLHQILTSPRNSIRAMFSK